MNFFEPVWPVSSQVRAIVTTRNAGNLATHVGNPEEALLKREALISAANLPGEPQWLEQVHGDRIVHVTSVDSSVIPEGDAAMTETASMPIVVMVADCLPVLLATREGDAIAVVHAGWQGLAKNIISKTVTQFDGRPLVAWLGPAIGPCHYEVDERVRAEFAAETGFASNDETHWMMDLYAIAREQLMNAGVSSISGGDFCTWCDPRFFSHRESAWDESKPEGRIAVVAWIENSGGSSIAG